MTKCSQLWYSSKQCCIQKYFLHQEHRIIAGAPHMKQSGISWISFPEKQKSTGFSKCGGRSSMYLLLNQGYLKGLWNCGEDSCICVKDCNLTFARIYSKKG